MLDPYFIPKKNEVDTYVLIWKDVHTTLFREMKYMKKNVFYHLLFVNILKFLSRFINTYILGCVYKYIYTHIYLYTHTYVYILFAYTYIEKP